MTLRALGHHHLIAYARRFDACDARTVAESRLVSDGCFRFDEARPDLVHILFDGAYALRALREASSCGIPQIVSFHGGFDTHVVLTRDGIRAELREAVGADTIITVPSEADRGRLLAVVPTGRCERLNVPIDSRHSVVVSGARTDLLMVGRLIERKGLDVALDMLDRLHTINSSKPRLIVVGDGPLRSKLEEHRDRLRLGAHVTFVGPQSLSGVLVLLSRSAALVHPGRVTANGDADGIPQIVLWAFAAGTPVVAASAGSVVEIVRHEQTGLLVPPEDPCRLATAVSRILVDDELRNRLSRGAAAVVREHALPAVVARLEELYVNAVAARRN
jgi:glycosyltransferase involved in cell wall biosynthesis